MFISKSFFSVCFNFFKYLTNIKLFTDPNVLEVNTILDELIEIINDVEYSKKFIPDSLLLLTMNLLAL